MRTLDINLILNTHNIYNRKNKHFFNPLQKNQNILLTAKTNPADT